MPTWTGARNERRFRVGPAQGRRSARGRRSVPVLHPNACDYATCRRLRLYRLLRLRVRLADPRERPARGLPYPASAALRPASVFSAAASCMPPVPPTFGCNHSAARMRAFWCELLRLIGAGCDERDDVKLRRRQKRVCVTPSFGTTRRAVAATAVADSAAAGAGTWRGVR